MSSPSRKAVAGNPPYPIPPTVPAPDVPEPFSDFIAQHEELRRNSWAEVNSPTNRLQSKENHESPLSSTDSEWDSCDDAVSNEKVTTSVPKEAIPASPSINTAGNATNKLSNQLNGPVEDELESSNAVWEDVAQLNIHEKTTTPIAELPTQKSPTSSKADGFTNFPNFTQFPFGANSSDITTDGPSHATPSAEPSEINPVSVPGSNPWRKYPIETYDNAPEAASQAVASDDPWLAQESFRKTTSHTFTTGSDPQVETRNDYSTPGILVEDVDHEPAPQLPARRLKSTDYPPSLPPRTSNHSLGAIAKQQKAEHYQVKRITWRDLNGQTRQSPILIQNANGPCPLLALVNAYILSTPTNCDTPLIETLKLREHVSLGLLLDAVFEELTSRHRGEDAQALPDLSELYIFLVTLHSGMNVNPRFVTDVCSRNLIDADSSSLLDMHPAFRQDAKPGCFDETKEMALYSTFSIPLIHGWLPPPDSATYDAFFRVAKTYEDTQNILLKEEELENKLRSYVLNEEEQQLLLDITLIKEFLSTWQSQLSEYGLSIIKKSLRPGQFAIMFRNDHFSTLYKDTHSDRLFTLVTDAGYAGHDRIIWESLVDVSGQANEFFSGDFTVVRDAPNAKGYVANELPIRSLLDDDDDEQPGVNSTNQGNGQASSSRFSAASYEGFQANSSLTDKTEQEDHDLALALQLQEEEEDRHRREEESRRNEQAESLSRTFLSQDSGQDIRPLVPPRRNMHNRNQSSGNISIRNNNNNNNNNNINNSRTGLRINTSGPANSQTGAGANAGTGTGVGTEAEAGPPPAYDQAASERPYIPPAGHPASPEAPVQRFNDSFTTHTNASANVIPTQSQAQINAGNGTAPNARQRFSRVSPLIGQASSTIASGIQRRQQQQQQQQQQGLGQQQGQHGVTAQGLRPEESREKCIVM